MICQSVASISFKGIKRGNYHRRSQTQASQLQQHHYEAHYGNQIIQTSHNSPKKCDSKRRNMVHNNFIKKNIQSIILHKNKNREQTNKFFNVNYIKANCDNLNTIKDKILTNRNKENQTPRRDVKIFLKQDNFIEEINTKPRTKDFIYSDQGKKNRIKSHRKVTIRKQNNKQRFQRIKETSKTTPKNSMMSELLIDDLVTSQKINKIQNANQETKNFIPNLNYKYKNQSELNTWRKELRIICLCLQQLIVFGTLQKKLNKWIENYFRNKKNGYLEVFMKKIHQKKSLANQIYYQAYKSSEIILDNIIKKMTKFTQKEMYFMGLQITQYRNFLEEKIANKHQLQLLQVEENVKNNVQKFEMKQYAKNIWGNRQYSNEIFSFYTDLQRVEAHYGQLNLLSVKNRRRFQHITDSQIQIREYLA